MREYLDTESVAQPADDGPIGACVAKCGRPAFVDGCRAAGWIATDGWLQFHGRVARAATAAGFAIFDWCSHRGTTAKLGHHASARATRFGIGTAACSSENHAAASHSDWILFSTLTVCNWRLLAGCWSLQERR